MHIGRRDISDVLSSLADLHPVSEVIGSVDLFVSTLGFEDRAPALASRFSQEGALSNAIMILLEYPKNVFDNQANLSHFEKASQNALAFQSIRYQRDTYFRSVEHMLAELKLRTGARVVFDISSCSSFVFYPTMRALMDLDVEITLVYSEATKYSPARDEWEEVAHKASQERSMFIESFENAEFQSTGVDDVYPSALFSEMNPGNRPSVFVGVPNFSAGRMNALITRDQEMNKTAASYWIIGEPPSPDNDWRIEAIRRTNNLDSVHPSNLRLVSTLQYKEMLKALEDIWFETRHNYYLSIGTLGSKMQHVGTYFFLCLHKDVSLLLTEPKSFRTTKYSSGVGPAWKIELGSTRKLREALESYMTFQWKF